MRKAASESASFCNLLPKKFPAGVLLNLIAFISLLLIQKVVHSEDHFLRVSFPSQVSSSRESGKCEGGVTHQWSNRTHYYIHLKETCFYLSNKIILFTSIGGRKKVYVSKKTCSLMIVHELWPRRASERPDRARASVCVLITVKHFSHSHLLLQQGAKKCDRF